MSRRLAALGDRDFRWFFLARAVVLVTGSMSSIALAFDVPQIDNRADSLSLVLASMIVGNIVFLLLGGVIADRFRRAAVLQTCYVVDALSLATMAALLFSHTATVPLLSVLAAVNGASSAFSMPAMQGLIPQLATPAHLQQANALLSFVQSAVTIGGPIVAGVLVAAASPAWAMAVEAVGVATAIPLLALVRLPAPVHEEKSGMFADLRQGWQEVRSRSRLWSVVPAFTVLNAVEIGAWSVAGPYIAKNTPTLGIAGWGWVVGAQGVGVLITAVVLLRVPLRRPLRYGMIGMAAMALPLTMLGVYRQYCRWPPQRSLRASASRSSALAGISPRWRTSRWKHCRGCPVTTCSAVSSPCPSGHWLTAGSSPTST